MSRNIISGYYGIVIMCFGAIFFLIMGAAADKMTMQVKTQDFGTLEDGRKVIQYLLENDLGTRVSIINLGAVITELHTVDKNGDFSDIVLGFDNPQQYFSGSPYFGAVVGRYGNRIAKGKFILNDQTYILATNNNENHLHGGNVGFDKRLWLVNINENNSLTLSLTSEDNDQGYPGTLNVSVTYTLTEDNKLIIDYQAKTDKLTVVNLTQHSYFNLAGHDSGDILNHQLTLNADYYTPVDSSLIPTGELLPVANTALNFTTSVAIGKRINNDEKQLEFGGGYDHNWVLNSSAHNLEQVAAKVVEPISGRTLTVHTDQPGIQFYAGNFLDGSLLGKEETFYKHRNGFCLETQHFPDSPNQPSFPTTSLRPDETYSSRTIYSFGVEM